MNSVKCQSMQLFCCLREPLKSTQRPGTIETKGEAKVNLLMMQSKLGFSIDLVLQRM